MIRVFWAFGYVGLILMLALAVYGAGHAVSEFQAAPNGLVAGFHRAAERRHLRRLRARSSAPRNVITVREPLDRAGPNRLRSPAAG